MKNKVGRPSKYEQKYCQQIIDFFSPPFFDQKTTEKGQSYYKSGELKYEHEKSIEVARPLRFVAQFARKIGVNPDTLYEWEKRSLEFSESFKMARALQKEHLITCGLKGLFNPSFSIFSAKNMIGWRDESYLRAIHKDNF